jgi:putative MATE family efflux protein
MLGLRSMGWAKPGAQPLGTAPAMPAQKPGAARTRLLLEGPIVSTLLRLAAPNLVVNVVLIAVTASVDAHFVGQLSSSALAGLSLVFPMMMLMQQMANFSMGGAVASAVARAIGAGRREDAAALVIHGLVIACGMGALFAAVFLVAGPSFYAFMGGNGPILAAAVEYSNAIFAGALAYWLLSTLTSVVRGTGQVGVLAVVYLAAEALHVLLVPILVFGVGPIPPLGITGAGVATVTSFTVSTAVLAWYLASGRTAVTLSLRGVRFDPRLFREILRVGAPLSLQPVFYNFGLAALTAYAGTLGATALASFGAAVRLEYVLYPLIFGLGAALPAMVGTNIGAGQFARAVRIAWTAAALSATMAGAVGLLAMIWPNAWTALFSASPAVQTMAASYLCVVAVAYPFLGLNTLTSAFQAMGQTLWPLLAVASRVLLVVIGGWIVIHATDTGLIGLGVVAAAGLILAGAIIAIAFRIKTRLGTKGG